MVVIVAVNVWQSVGRGCLFYWFQNQRIKIHKKEEDKRKARKRSSLAVENPKGTASVICLSLVGRGGVIVGGLVLVRLRLVLTKLV